MKVKVKIEDITAASLPRIIFTIVDEDSGRTITLRGEEPGPEEETMLQCKSVEDVTLLHPQHCYRLRM